MPINVGLIGFGTVGQAVSRRLLRDQSPRLRLTRVCVRRGVPRQRPVWLPASVDWTDRFEALLAPDIDVIVELAGGIEPARTWAMQALLAGKSVVCANKQLIANAGDELLSLAARTRCSLRFEGAVAGGVPVIRAIQDGLAGDRLVSVGGVLSGTCNYILTRIEEAGLSFEDALEEARAHGYAEADPTADIEGIDARAKLAILATVALDIRVRPSTIPCDSIRTITHADFVRARDSGCTIRQLSSAERCVGARPALCASVRPVLVPFDSPFARARGCENVIVVRGEYGGETTFAGQGAGGEVTAVAVISDLLAVAAGNGANRVPVVPFDPVASLSAVTAARPILHPSLLKGHLYVAD